MAKIILLFFLLHQSKTTMSLQCYTCIGASSECRNLQKLSTTTCLNEDVCAVYALKNRDDKEIVYRGCFTATICSRLATLFEKNSAVVLQQCRVCDQDRCNYSTLVVSSGNLVPMLLILVHMFQ